MLIIYSLFKLHKKATLYRAMLIVLKPYGIVATNLTSIFTEASFLPRKIFLNPLRRHWFDGSLTGLTGLKRRVTTDSERRLY